MSSDFVGLNLSLPAINGTNLANNSVLVNKLGKIDSCGIRCQQCHQVIGDHYYLSTRDKQWHTSCLRCSQCLSYLGSNKRCYFRDGLVYCVDDYFKKFTYPCTRCGRGIYSTDLVMKVTIGGILFVFHLNCFACAWCNQPLAPGDYFGIKDKLAYCRVHYEVVKGFEEIGCNPLSIIGKGFELSKNSSLTSKNVIELNQKLNLNVTKIDKFSLEKSEPNNTNSQATDITQSSLDILSTMSGELNLPSQILLHHEEDEGKVTSDQQKRRQAFEERQKRKRTSFKSAQLKLMKACYDVNPNPDIKILEILAEKTALNRRVLQVWFQNMRAKKRREKEQPKSDFDFRLADLDNSKSPAQSSLTGSDFICDISDEEIVT